MVRVFSQYVSQKTILLSSLETLLIMLAVLCGVRLRFWNSPSDFAFYTQFPDFFLQLFVLIAALQISFYYNDLYRPRTFRRRSDEVLRIVQSLGGASVCLGVLYWCFPELLIGRGVFFLSLSLVAILVLLTRLLLDRVWSFAAPMENVLILGSQELGVTVARELKTRKDLNLNLIGFINPQSSIATPASIEGAPVFGHGETLEDVTAEQNVSRIVVALEERRGSLPTRELVRLKVRGILVEDAQSILSSLTGRVWLQTIRPSWFVFTAGFHRSKMTVVLKRIMDVALSAGMLLVTAPIMLLVGIAIRVDSKGSVLYRQARVGRRGDVFNVLKFRSMRPDAEEENGVQWAQADDLRATRVGKLLRKYRLDELPQLINVLRGQMSFVGPRPERPYFVEQLRKEIPYYDERHSVRPGLTGWAQVQCQYGASIEDAFRKLEYDLFYLKNLSLLFDCAIILRTVRIVMTGAGSR